MCRVNIDIYRKIEYRNIVEFQTETFCIFTCKPAIVFN